MPGAEIIAFSDLAYRVLPVRAAPLNSRTDFSRKGNTMNRIAEANRIIEKAKQQRAELIGSKLRANALPIVAVLALSFASLQFMSETGPQHVFHDATAQVG